MCVLMLTSCAATKKYMTYTIYPVGYLLNRIGGNKIESISIQNNSMVQMATVVDNYQEILENSLFFFHIGNLEPYMDLYSEEIKESEVSDVDLSTLNAIYDFKRYSLVYVNGQATYIEGPYYEGESFEEIDTLSSDLYLWLDPIGMLSMAKDVYTTLQSNYVEQSDYFTANYNALESDLISLDASYQALATELRNEGKTISFVSMSNSFGTWQKAYGFQVYPICLSKYGAIPSDEQLEIIKQKIIDDGVKYIVYEPNMPEQLETLYEELKEELSLKRINLSNISSLTSSQLNDSKDYLSIMKDNLAVLESIASEE